MEMRVCGEQMTETTIHITTSLPTGRNSRQDGTYMWVIEAMRDGTIYTKEGTGYKYATTRNRITLSALDDALGRLKDGVEVKVYADAAGVRYPIEEGWIYRWYADGWRRSQVKNGRKYYLPLENADLWERIFYQLENHPLTWADGEADSYRSYMLSALKRNRKQIMIEHYKEEADEKRDAERRVQILPCDEAHRTVRGSDAGGAGQDRLGGM